MESITIGFDVNLGFPEDFSKNIPSEIIPYTDMDKLIAAFNNQEVDSVFAPAGTLPYLNKYDIIAQSMFGSHLKLTLQSNLVASEIISIFNITYSSLGRVNKACTTSFWSPIIYLMNYLPQHTLLNFQEEAGFQDMLFKTAEKKIGSAMVWDIILQQNSQAAKKVHLLGMKNDLPTPIIYAKKNFPLEVKEKICKFRSADAETFFQGFTEPDLNAIKKFANDMQRAKDFFEIKVKEYKPTLAEAP